MQHTILTLTTALLLSPLLNAVTITHDYFKYTSYLYTSFSYYSGYSDDLIICHPISSPSPSSYTFAGFKSGFFYIKDTDEDTHLSFSTPFNKVRILGSQVLSFNVLFHAGVTIEGSEKDFMFESQIIESAIDEFPDFSADLIN